MGIDKNMNLSDLVKKIKLDKYTIIFSSTLLFLIIGGGYFNSILVYENFKDEKKLKELREKAMLVKDTKIAITGEEEKIKEILSKIDNFQTIFYDKTQKDKFIEEFNALIIKHNLLTLNIVKLKEELIKNVDEANKEKNIDLFEKIDFQISINGDFNDYMNFKKEMQENTKILTIVQEDIKSLKEDGIVKVDMILSIYKLIEDNLNTKDVK